MLEDKSIVTATAQTITCFVSGLTGAADFDWMDSAGNILSDDADYDIVHGNFNSDGTQKTTLVIYPSILGGIVDTATYQVKVKSTTFPLYSPEVIEDVILTAMQLGKPTLQFLHNNCTNCGRVLDSYSIVF